MDDEEYEDLQNNPEKWEQVIDNSIQDGYDLMYPDPECYDE